MESSKKINPYYIVLGVAVLAAILMLVSFFLLGSDEKNPSYVQKIQTYRIEKDKVFKNSEDSPIDDKTKFDGLLYFYPNAAYIVEARLSLTKDSTPVTILRSNSKRDTYLKYATATFELNKREHKVSLLKPIGGKDSEYLFLPFSDLTAGRETYGGGRYLDLEIPEGNKIEIDFNLAYNPYCAYNYRYSCPLPPKENFIDTEIRAGEKIYKH